MQHTVIPSWYQREGYIKAMADLIQKELGNFDSSDEVIMIVEILHASFLLFQQSLKLLVQVSDIIESET